MRLQGAPKEVQGGPKRTPRGPKRDPDEAKMGGQSSGEPNMKRKGAKSKTFQKPLFLNGSRLLEDVKLGPRWPRWA